MPCAELLHVCVTVACLLLSYWWVFFVHVCCRYLASCRESRNQKHCSAHYSKPSVTLRGTHRNRWWAAYSFVSCVACSCRLCLDLNISSGKSAHIQINAQITDSRSLIRRVARLNCTSEALMIGFAFFCLYRSNFTVPPQLQIFADVTELVAKGSFASVSKSCSCLQQKCTAEETVICITK